MINQKLNKCLSDITFSFMQKDLYLLSMVPWNCVSQVVTYAIIYNVQIHQTYLKSTH